MKILFLDIDGVLNSHQHYLMFGDNSKKIFDTESLDFRFSPYNVWNLDFILNNEPELKVVIHSSVRKYFTLQQIKENLSKYSKNTNKILDITNPFLQRSESIYDYLKNNFVEKHLILDDYAVPPHYQLQIHPMTGLTYIDAVKAISWFNPDFKPPVLLF